MKNRSFRASVLKRLIISFICILLPLYALAIFMYNNGLMILRQELSSSMTAQVSFYLEQLEKEAERIRSLQYDLIIDRDINRMATIPQAMSNIQRVESLLRIQQRIIAVNNSSVYIESVSLMLPAAKKKVTAQTITDFDQEEFDKLKQVPNTYEGKQISNIDGDLYMNLSYPQWYLTKREPIFVISIKLSERAFEEGLHSMAGNPGEGVAIYNIADGRMIATEYNEDLHNVFQHQIEEKTDEMTGNAEVMEVGGKRFMVVYRKSEYFQSVINKYVPEKSVLESMEIYNIWFFIFSLLALAIIVVYSFYVKKFIYKPLTRLADSFGEVKKSNFKIHIEHRHDDEFRLIYQHFNAMVKELADLIDQTYKQKLLIQRAEMKQLQSQINPHFLYNSFFILNTMSRIGDNESLERFTEQLGRYFQFVTRSAADEVTLMKEVEHARVYTEIQAMRYSNRIKAEFDDLPEAFSSMMVPRLILQPIIENAFEHGLGTMQSGGILSVRFRPLSDRLSIVVENNGEEIDDEKMNMLQGKLIENKDQSTEITAIQNIHQRLQLKFGKAFGLLIERGAFGGLRVILSIPWEENEVKKI